MEFLFTLMLAFVVGFVAVFYAAFAIFVMLLPIIFWIFVIWLVIRIIKRYT